jgi:hypothetical protein
MNARLIGRAVVTLVIACEVPMVAGKQVFRAGTNGVLVDVAVFNGNQPVADLTKGDFEVTDNGIRQVVVDASIEQLPVDVSLVIDLSASISPSQLDDLTAAVKQVGDELWPVDRCRLLVFGDRVAERAPLGPWPIPIDLSNRDSLVQSTALFDATALALMQRSTPGRRQLVVVLTDGGENTSTIDGPGLLTAVRHSDAVVDFILASTRAFINLTYSDTLGAATSMSGGRRVELGRRADIGPGLRASIDAMHKSYLVRYVLAGVPAKGWHDITVKVPKSPRYTVRARQGYFGE